VLIGEIFGLCDRRLLWTAFGVAYVALAAYALVSLRSTPEMGLLTVTWVFVLVWAADTGAYLTGRTFGGPKLAPVISPNKTWSGFGGALLFSGAAGGLVGIYMEKNSLSVLVACSAVLGATSQCGDLLESWIKRRFDRKDVSKLIPGHGGLFDRADGLVAAAIAAWIADRLTEENILTWL